MLCPSRNRYTDTVSVYYNHALSFQEQIHRHGQCVLQPCSVLPGTDTQTRSVCTTTMLCPSRNRYTDTVSVYYNHALSFQEQIHRHGQCVLQPCSVLGTDTQTRSVCTTTMLCPRNRYTDTVSVYYNHALSFQEQIHRHGQCVLQPCSVLPGTDTQTRSVCTTTMLCPSRNRYTDTVSVYYNHALSFQEQIHRHGQCGLQPCSVLPGTDTQTRSLCTTTMLCPSRNRYTDTVSVYYNHALS